MKRTILIAITLSAVLAITATGCGAVQEKAGEVAAEKMLEQASGGKVDINKGGKEVTVKDKDGNSMVIGNSTKLPDNFPKEFPIYDGAKPQTSMTNSQNGKTSFTVSFASSDEPSKVLEFYKAELPKNGYVINSSFEMDGASTLGLTKNDENIGNIVINKGEDDKGTAIIVSIVK